MLLFHIVDDWFSFDLSSSEDKTLERCSFTLRWRMMADGSPSGGLKAIGSQRVEARWYMKHGHPLPVGRTATIWTMSPLFGVAPSIGFALYIRDTSCLTWRFSSEGQRAVQQVDSQPTCRRLVDCVRFSSEKQARSIDGGPR